MYIPFRKMRHNPLIYQAGVVKQMFSYWKIFEYSLLGIFHSVIILLMVLKSFDTYISSNG